jgi:signal transduction histidine kinase
MNGAGSILIQGIALPQSVEVAISDSGPGIAPELHNQIFELNFSRSASHPGKLGFGLWWVKTLMTRLGGSVSVESDGRYGTTFRLRLPTTE